jgi:hypothetical protein
MEEILQFTKGMGSSSQSTVTVDQPLGTINKQTHMGKSLEEYITSKNLYIMIEKSELTTFQNRRGSSNIDLTIVNNELLKPLKNWEISEEESCSDHNIITFGLGQNTHYDTAYNHTADRYVVTGENLRILTT